MNPALTVRPAEVEDTVYLKKWLMQPEVLQWFPMCDEKEIDDSIRVWTSYISLKAAVTACIDGIPVGMSNVYVQPYEKFAHQALFSILVDSAHHGKGVGTLLLTELMKLAKEEHKIELLHLEVYDKNPAIFLYEKMGFKIYGKEPRFIKYEGEYADKILMQRRL